jgi:alcohol dehydrogenase YqhD (iron-dependent ADH family)
LDPVVLTADLPDRELAAGDVGAVVHVYEGGHSYQVEFTTYDGRTVAVTKVSAAQIRPLGSKEIHHARAFEPAVG